MIVYTIIIKNKNFEAIFWKNFLSKEEAMREADDLNQSGEKEKSNSEQSEWDLIEEVII